MERNKVMYGSYIQVLLGQTFLLPYFMMHNLNKQTNQPHQPNNNKNHIEQKPHINF